MAKTEQPGACSLRKAAVASALELLAQLPGGIAAVIGEEKVFLILIVQPLDKFRYTGQDMVAMVDDTIHITDEALLFIKIEIVHFIILPFLFISVPL